MPHCILICEDDVHLSGVLQQHLRASGYHTTVVRTGRQVLEEFSRLSRAAGNQPSLLLLDLMLPDMDGFDVCRRLRANCTLPIIMISGRAGEVDRIIGLEIGADDYLTKPFGISELIARIDARLRRCTDYGQQAISAETQQIGELTLNRAAHQVLLRGQALHLTPKEYDLLSVLAEQRGAVVRSAQLLLRVWGYNDQIRTRTLDVHIGRLRAKIEADTRQPRYLLTVPGVGYRLCVPEEISWAA